LDLGFSFGLDWVFVGFGSWFFVWIGLFVSLTIQDYATFLMHKSIFQHYFQNYVFVRTGVPLGYVISVLILNDFDRFCAFCLSDPVGKCEVDLGRPEGGIGFCEEVRTSNCVAHFAGMKNIQNIEIQAAFFLENILTKREISIKDPFTPALYQLLRRFIVHPPLDVYSFLWGEP